MASGPNPLHPRALTVEGLHATAFRYQQMLAENPSQPEALMGLALIAMASDQQDAAIHMAWAAVHAVPGYGVAWVTLGQACKAAGHMDDARQAYEEALSLDGMDALAHLGLGELKLASGDAEEALREYDMALRRQPAMVAAHMGLGHALACSGRNAEALERYEQALIFQPQTPEAHFAAAFVLARLGRTGEAEARYRRALVLRPDFAAAWMNLGCLLREQGKPALAEAALERAVELRPSMIPGWINLAQMARDRRDAPLATARLERAFALNPEQVETQIAWCQFRAAENDLAGAWRWLHWALERKPNNAEAVNMRGVLLHTEGRYDEAVEVFAKALELGSPAAASNQGNSLMDLGRHEDALRAHEQAVEREPQSAGARYNLALTRLRMGQWHQGWQDYEARWQFREVHPALVPFQQPRWRGEPLAGRSILLHAEQGLGDAIQFSRYAALVAARGGQIVLQVHSPLLRLMESLAVVRSGCARLASLGEQPPSFDLECPLMSLPSVFGTELETTPWLGAYLGADSALAGQRLLQFPPDGRFRVGLAWAGNPRYKADRRRSTHLEGLIPLLRCKNVAWFSLQKSEAAAEIAALPAGLELRDASSADRDLADAAALIASLDLVITTDTSIAHLAGAMGKPVWILLSHIADWRWMQNRATTPWYPTARLLRQSAPGDWDGLARRTANLLEPMAVARPRTVRTLHTIEKRRVG